MRGGGWKEAKDNKKNMSKKEEGHPLLTKKGKVMGNSFYFSQHFHFQIDMRAFDIIYPILLLPLVTTTKGTGVLLLFT